MKDINKKIIFYFVLTFLFSWLLWLPSFLNSNVTAVPNALLAIGNLAILGPLVSALIQIKASKKSGEIKKFFKRAWQWNFNKIWLFPVLFIGPLVALVSLLIRNIFIGESFTLNMPLSAIPLFAIGMLFIGGPIEEFGWRGYALDLLLSKYSFIFSSLILGFFHGLWHLPLHYMIGTTQSYIPVYQFILVTITGSFIHTWIYINTNRSINTAIIYHWTANLGSALFMFWIDNTGRLIFFIVQIVLVLFIIKFGNVPREKMHNNNL